MSKLSVAHKTFSETLLGMGSGYVLNFTKTSFAQFFDPLGVDIYDAPYGEYGTSKAKRPQTLWQIASDVEVSATVVALAGYIEARHAASVSVAGQSATHDRNTKIRELARKLARRSPPVPGAGTPVPITTAALVTANRIPIEIHVDIYSHVEQFLGAEDYFRAVDESYKIVLEKLRELTGNEKATDVFNQAATGKLLYMLLFGKAEASDDAEADFSRGVGCPHLGVQVLRNKEAHTLVTPLEPNLAIHYIALARLAYDLIARYFSEETVQEHEELLPATRGCCGGIGFYDVFVCGEWMEELDLPASLQSASVGRMLKDKWLAEADYTRSYDHSDLVLLQLELVVDGLTSKNVDELLEFPTAGVFGNSQMAGLLPFLEEAKLSPKAKARFAEPTSG
ncbi:TIGR02391 family protein [Occultella glacieicola]|uniref:TIGR02391 family protein n=1 Tax=Occultella glacieicola TaxID=2518684 RepID=A0ABY2E4W7_9MICO|nr:TIGR02391 family protein [Occultella glacieicola]TDE95074.1 TIGR02391 family protein [Occultella glacieicola]